MDPHKARMNNLNAETNPPIPHPREAAFAPRPPKPPSLRNNPPKIERQTRPARTHETKQIHPKPYPVPSNDPALRDPSTHEAQGGGGGRGGRCSPEPGGPPPRRSPEPDIDRALLFSLRPYGVVGVLRLQWRMERMPWHSERKCGTVNGGRRGGSYGRDGTTLERCARECAFRSPPDPPLPIRHNSLTAWARMVGPEMQLLG